MDKERPKVLVVPEGQLYLAFRLLPVLQRAGYGVDVLCLPGDPVARSRYVDNSLIKPTADDQFAFLCDALRRAERPWQEVIVVDEKLARRLMDTNDAALLAYWQPGLQEPLAREFCLSKLGLVAAREHWQLPIPPTRICQSHADILDFGNAIGWPIIVKPPGEMAGQGVIKLLSAQELSTATALVFPIIAQQFIIGRKGVVDALFSQGRPLAWLSAYGTKTHRNEFGPSSARLFKAMPELQPLVEEIARRTRFEGFCGFDWVQETGTGKYWLVEFHPRASSGIRFGRKCGVDFVAAAKVWLAASAETFTPLVQANGTEVSAHYFSGDISRCLRQRDWQGLKAWLPGSGACHDVFWDDLPLLTAWIGARLRAVLPGRPPV